MILTTITDEVTENADIIEVFTSAINEGITNFEIRNVGGKRFPYIEDTSINQLVRLKKEYGLTYSAVSPGIFKSVCLKSEALNKHKKELLLNTIRKAEILEISRIIIFGIDKDPFEDPKGIEVVANEIGELALKAKEYGFSILIENESGTWADSSLNCNILLKLIKLSNVGLNWDPANLFKTGEHDYKSGYELLKPFIRNVHIKDAIQSINGPIFLPLGEGQIDYKGQIADLMHDAYNGNITVETHCKPLYESFLKSVAYLKLLINNKEGE